jgi:hypothetical protein
MGGSPEQALKIFFFRPRNLLGNAPENCLIVKVKKIFSEIGHDWYKKMQNFMLISKI